MKFAFVALAVLTAASSVLAAPVRIVKNVPCVLVASHTGCPSITLSLFLSSEYIYHVTDTVASNLSFQAGSLHPPLIRLMPSWIPRSIPAVLSRMLWTPRPLHRLRSRRLREWGK